MTLSKNYNISLLKCLCCLGVIVFHVSGNFAFSEQINFSIILYYSGCFCIPMFFLINGYLIFLHDQISLKYILKKIIKYIKIIFLWSLFFFLINKNKYQDSLLLSIYKNLKQEGDMPVLWFLGTLIIIYLFCIKPIEKVYKKKIAIVIGIIIFAFMWYIRKNNLVNIPQFLWIHVYMPYFYIGALMVKYKQHVEKVGKNIVYISIAYSFFVVAIMSYRKYYNIAISPIDYFDNIIYVLWILLIFISIMNIQIKKLWICKNIDFIEKNLLGIYLGLAQ